MACSNTERALSRLLPARAGYRLRSVPSPLLDLVEIVQVGDQRIVGLLVEVNVVGLRIDHGPIIDPPWTFSSFAQRTYMTAVSAVMRVFSCLFELVASTAAAVTCLLRGRRRPVFCCPDRLSRRVGGVLRPNQPLHFTNGKDAIFEHEQSRLNPRVARARAMLCEPDATTAKSYPTSGPASQVIRPQHSQHPV